MRPATLDKDISPPPTRKVFNVDIKPLELTTTDGPHYNQGHVENSPKLDAQPTLAAIEAGEAQIRDHLAYFVKHLSNASRPHSIGPRLNLDDFRTLYRQNQHARGCHFVIHQHDHPISGVHYDLRLQFSETSTISFAVPYGLPGNPNSVRQNRMAIETRVHNLWNNLIECASHATGSLLIWDTGTYEVIPRAEPKGKTTDDEDSDLEEEPGLEQPAVSHSEMLFNAFRKRHIRLRLHGTRLPSGYTIALRLPSSNDSRTQPRKPRTKRRRLGPAKAAEIAKQRTLVEDGGTSDDEPMLEGEVTDTAPVHETNGDAALASEGEGEDEDATIRTNNAYPGATNTIGSVHQRHWLISLDRKTSGFERGWNGRWKDGWEPFFVKGRDVERSVVTGRLADDVMSDEGVEKFVGRKMWRAILE